MGAFASGRRRSEFDLVFEQLMRDTGLGEFAGGGLIVETGLYRGKPLSFILEDIAKPTSVTTRHGDVILLEDTLELPDALLISEGILDAVKEKIGGVISKVASGLKEVLSKGWEAVKAFIQKAMSIGVIRKISDRCGLQSIASKDRIRKCFTIDVGKGGGGTVAEGVTIAEATRLSKGEEALTDPQEVQKYISRYQRHLSGEITLRNKKGLPLSRKYAADRLRLFKGKLDSLQQASGGEEATAGAKASPAQAPAQAQAQQEAGSEAKAPEAKAPAVKVGADPALLTETIEAMQSEALAKLDEANAAVSEGVPETKAEPEAKAEEGGSGEDKKGEKKGFLSRLGKMVDKGANFVRDKAKKAWNSISSDWVKALLKIALIMLVIWAIGSIVVAAISAVAAAFTAGGFLAGASAAVGSGFSLFYGGKKIQATVKAGQKAWESGTGWSDFFIQLSATVLSVIGFSQIAMLISNSKAVASKVQSVVS